MSFNTRNGNTTAPSGGFGLSKPLKGSGKLLAGAYLAEVIAVRPEVNGTLLLIADSKSKEVHSDWYEYLPPQVRVGLQVVADIQYGEGYIVGKNGGTFQAVDAKTKEPLTEWLTSLEDIYQQLQPKLPASTVLTKLTWEGGEYEPTVRRPEIHSPKEGEPSTQTTN